jgi:hypothetical protein
VCFKQKKKVALTWIWIVSVHWGHGVWEYVNFQEKIKIVKSLLIFLVGLMGYIEAFPTDIQIFKSKMLAFHLFTKVFLFVHQLTYRSCILSLSNFPKKNVNPLKACRRQIMMKDWFKKLAMVCGGRTEVSPAVDPRAPCTSWLQEGGTC